LSSVELLLTDHTDQAGLSGNQKCARSAACTIGKVHRHQSIASVSSVTLLEICPAIVAANSPGNVSGLSWVQLLLTDHIDQAGLSGNQSHARYAACTTGKVHLGMSVA